MQDRQSSGNPEVVGNSQEGFRDDSEDPNLGLSPLLEEEDAGTPHSRSSSVVQKAGRRTPHGGGVSTRLSFGGEHSGDREDHCAALGSQQFQEREEFPNRDCSQKLKTDMAAKAESSIGAEVRGAEERVVGELQSDADHVGTMPSQTSNVTAEPQQHGVLRSNNILCFHGIRVRVILCHILYEFRDDYSG
ncbi:hypothetical protein R1sor_012861 [Riccia sorocarpa]|uniref:Uncharacterized protein n=1 Tax=Riccia sorocarpa TaxID=122646 RepID=A0ABD3I8L0_9MARC